MKVFCTFVGLHGSNLMIPSASAAGAMGRGLLATCPSHDWCTWLLAMKCCLSLLSSHYVYFIMIFRATLCIPIHGECSKCCLIRCICHELLHHINDHQIVNCSINASSSPCHCRIQSAPPSHGPASWPHHHRKDIRFDSLLHGFSGFVALHFSTVWHEALSQLPAVAVQQ